MTTLIWNLIIRFKSTVNKIISGGGSLVPSSYGQTYLKESTFCKLSPPCAETRTGSVGPSILQFSFTQCWGWCHHLVTNPVSPFQVSSAVSWLRYSRRSFIKPVCRYQRMYKEGTLYQLWISRWWYLAGRSKWRRDIFHRAEPCSQIWQK
jgi:hypothetical protein